MAHDIFLFVNVFVVTNILTQNYHRFLYFFCFIQSVTYYFYLDSKGHKHMAGEIRENFPLRNEHKEVKTKEEVFMEVIQKIENMKITNRNDTRRYNLILEELNKKDSEIRFLIFGIITETYSHPLYFLSKLGILTQISASNLDLSTKSNSKSLKD